MIYLGTKKNIHITYKKLLKNNKKIKIIKTKQNKKKKQMNFKCNINVKAMTSEEHQKSCASNFLVSIKKIMVASNMLALLIL